MTLVSSKEFIANEDKYFDLALNGGVCIHRDEYMFHLVSVEKRNNSGMSSRVIDSGRITDTMTIEDVKDQAIEYLTIDEAIQLYRNIVKDYDSND